MSTMKLGEQRGRKTYRCSIVNGTFTGDLNTRMPNLGSLKLPFAVEYNPLKLNAAIVKRLNNESGTVLLFESGRIVLVGVTTRSEAEELAGALEKALFDMGVTCKLTNIACKNIVVTTKVNPTFVQYLWFILDNGPLDKLTENCSIANIKYEFQPHLFRSIKFYLKEPKACVSVFRTGVTIITGIVEFSIVDTIIGIIEHLLDR